VDDHGHGVLQYGGTPVPKRMNQLGNPHGAKVKGFFRPVRERVDIEAELRQLAEAEEAEKSRPRELTD